MARCLIHTNPTVMSELYRSIPIRSLSTAELTELSRRMKLSLSGEDMEAIRKIFTEMDREPTDVELEVIAQTWSEHCKHRIFSAEITHTVNGKEEVIPGIFKTFIKKPSEEIMASKPGFVLSAFTDNAGFIALDDELSVCLKVETHNHPSAIEPYAGANTGLGGVIRDILGAGKGAKPIANIDVFCFGAPDTAPAAIQGRDVIHPLGIMRGVVHGVRDYGNRMGIPTTTGAIQFDPAYIYNPLVYCGTAGVIPRKDILKEMRPGLRIIVIGGRTGRDGLHGATFSSAGMGETSHEEDQTAVQIGNPIEEKKALDFILEARKRDLIVFITDCGAGGFSSAAGEMLSETGGEIFLERAPLKEPGLVSWQIFLSESQERMVLAVEAEKLPELRKLADTFQTELTELGHSDDSGILRVWHHDHLVCSLDNRKLHEAPVKKLRSVFTAPAAAVSHNWPADNLAGDLERVISDFAVVSREPIIREYDHEVQGNTLLKPLAGASADAPQDASVLAIDGSAKAMAMACAILPEWGKTDPRAMGTGTVDECVRQLILAGANPDKIALLDNFCMGDPEDPEELGRMVECTKGIALAALAFHAPYVSGKDSFYNYFDTEHGPINVPVSFLCSGFGVVEDTTHILGSSLRRPDSLLYLIGNTEDEMGGSVYARIQGVHNARVPQTDCAKNFALYKAFHTAACSGLVLSAHDISEGGIAVTAAEMAFSGKGGLDIDLAAMPTRKGWGNPAVALFSESTGRILCEVKADRAHEFELALQEHPCACIGHSAEKRELRFRDGARTLLRADLARLKALWKNGLVPFY
ncbi:MAG: phosphoribosylformylglycinamidine synthase subunit PurL [Akkermansiaceae bacterium]|nr:phosphoribosylformylglycinamidine synthase subunit PurL [Akkermansiaceae bacterium]